MLTQIQLNDIGCNKDSCAGTVLLHRAAFQWANSTRPLSSIHSAGHWSTRKWKEKTRKETRKEKRNFTPSLGHFRFFLQSREKGLEGYIYTCTRCIVYTTTSTTLTAIQNVYTFGSSITILCLIGQEINLALRGFFQRRRQEERRGKNKK